MMNSGKDDLRNGACLILVTGGASNGKSSFAVEYCSAIPGKRFFLDATPAGEPDERTEAALSKLRSEGAFHVMSAADFPDASDADIVLLDCICKLTASEMFDTAGTMTDPFPAVMKTIRQLRTNTRILMVITNAVGSDGREYAHGIQAYIRALGRINAALAKEADHVWEIVCGIPVTVKGSRPNALKKEEAEK